MWIPVSTLHTIQIQSATKQIEKPGFGRLIKNSQSGLVCMVSASWLCHCLDWWSSCLISWGLSWANLLQHCPVAVRISDFCRAGEVCGAVWAPLWRETLCKIRANATVLGLGKEKNKHTSKSLLSLLYFNHISAQLT